MNFVGAFLKVCFFYLFSVLSFAQEEVSLPTYFADETLTQPSFLEQSSKKDPAFYGGRLERGPK